MANDMLIYSFIDLYYSIKNSSNDLKGIRKIINNFKIKSRLKRLHEMIDNLPSSNLILDANTIIEFTSYILYTSQLKMFGSIADINEIRNDNKRNVYILYITDDSDYSYSVKLDADNLFMDIAIKWEDNNHNTITANTKLESLRVKNDNNNVFIEKSIAYLNKVLLINISNYISYYLLEKDAASK